MRTNLKITLVLLCGMLFLMLHFELKGAEQLLYSTYLGGDLTDTAVSIAADPDGNAYITGATQSTQFPAAKNAVHGIDVYAAKFSADGAQLAYVLWFNAVNAADVDEGLGIAVDANGGAVVTGHTRSADFCTLFGAPPGYDTTYNGNGDAFLLKVKPDGSGLDFCTFLGGSDWDLGTAITFDAAGNIIVTGGTWSTDFPVTSNAYQTTIGGQRDSFVARFDPGGAQLSYATYFGGSGQDESRALAVNAQNRLAISGWTNSADLPTSPNSLIADYQGNFDGFLAQFEADLSTLQFVTYVGGSEEDRATAVALNQNGAAVVAGHTLSPDFPTTPQALQPALAGGRDGFVLRLNPNGDDLAYGSYLGGGGDDEAAGLALDMDGAVTLTGITGSADFPTSSQALFAAYAGEEDAFVAQLGADGRQLLYGSFLGGGERDGGTAVALTTDHTILLTGATRSPDFPTTPSAYDINLNGDFDIFVTRLNSVKESEYPQYFLPIIRSK